MINVFLLCYVRFVGIKKLIDFLGCIALYACSCSCSFSSTTLCEFWVAQLFLSIVSFPAPFVSNWSPPFPSNHSSHRLPILLLAFHLYMVLAALSIVILSTCPNQLSRLYL